MIRLSVSGLCLLSCLCSNANAQQVQLIEPLRFGTVALLSNLTPEQLTVSSLGNIGYSQAVRPIISASPAEILVSGYPANAILEVRVQILQAGTGSSIPSSEQFTLINIDAPDRITTNVNGEVRLFVGGTIQTSGSGSLSYLDTEYTARFRVTVDYP